MPARSAEAIEAAVAATGLLDVGRPGERAAPGGMAVHDGPLLLLCSAGRDSACLLDLATRARGAAGVRVLHVDHALRDASRHEAELVRAACAERSAGLTVRRLGAAPSAGNLHAWARSERRRAAVEEARRVGASAIVTAHTRTDLVETALFRLATQPGRRALLAMRSMDVAAPQLPLLRPLLEITREETLAYGVARRLRWAEDPSNADRRFARARLRHSVTPTLRTLNPAFEANVVRTLGELADEREALDAIVASVLPAGATEVTVEALASPPAAVGRLVLRELCERAIGGPCARAAHRLDEVLGKAAAQRTPFALDVGDGARVVVRQGVVRAESSRGPAAPRTGA